jgi:GNAT superfamily N-acetyltransferase
MTHLRTAQPDDADAIAEIHIAARREAMPWLPAIHTDDETRAWVARVVLPHQTVWVAETDGEIIGYVAVDGSELNDLYVRPGWQGQGVGSALLERAKALGPGELSLWAFQRNTGARRFYERHGFTLVELTEGADNEEREPDSRYRWVAGSDAV